MKIRAPGPAGTYKVGSGVLVNNGYGNAGWPFLVTAAHLLDTDDDGDLEAGEAQSAAMQSVFYFGLDATCNGQAVAEPYEVLGALYLTSDEVFDLALLQLDVLPDELQANANPYFVGWDFNETSPLHVHMLHHPCCDTRMVSGGEAPDDFNGYLRLDGLTCGGVQPGSSGGPLFSTATGNLVGILSGVQGFGDEGPVIGGEVCAGEDIGILYSRFSDFGFQHLSAFDSLPPYDPAAP